jgi:light-independent protochlorophyllide reductase subunit B
MMGLEEHLLTMFRDDFEFHDGANASHIGPITDGAAPAAGTTGAVPKPDDALSWAPDAEQELGKIPFFVRGKARRNTEQYARDRHVDRISVETLYEAKAHYAR